MKVDASGCEQQFCRFHDLGCELRRCCLMDNSAKRAALALTKAEIVTYAVIVVSELTQCVL